jgi:hypothetical protein
MANSKIMSAAASKTMSVESKTMLAESKTMSTESKILVMVASKILTL